MISLYPIGNCSCLIIDPGSTVKINYPSRSLFHYSRICTPEAFVLKVKMDLDKIASKPVGQDLLQLIAKRHKGVGTQFGKTVTIKCGMPTLSPPPGETSSMSRTSTIATDPNDKEYMSTKNVAGTPMLFAGCGSSADIYYDPNLNYDSIVGIKTPTYVALAHELIHAYHYLSGSLIGDMALLPKSYDRLIARFQLIEEAKTVGAGDYKSARISENAIRREHNIKERQYYWTPGDCDKSFLESHSRPV